MVLTVRRTKLRQLDLVSAVQMIDLSDHLPIGLNYVHVFLDLRNVCHWYLSFGIPGFVRKQSFRILCNTRQTADQAARATERRFWRR